MSILIELEKALIKIEEFFARVTRTGDRVDKVEKDIQELMQHPKKLYSELEKLRERVESLAMHISSQDSVIKSHEVLIKILQDAQQDNANHDKKLYNEIYNLEKRFAELRETVLHTNATTDQARSVGNYSNEAQTNKGWEILTVRDLDTGEEYESDGKDFKGTNIKEIIHADGIYGNRNFKITAICNHFTKEVWYGQSYRFIAGIYVHIKDISSGKDGRITINFTSHLDK